MTMMMMIIIIGEHSNRCLVVVAIVIILRMIKMKTTGARATMAAVAVTARQRCHNFVSHLKEVIFFIVDLFNNFGVSYFTKLRF